MWLISEGVELLASSCSRDQVRNVIFLRNSSLKMLLSKPAKLYLKLCYSVRFISDGQLTLIQQPNSLSSPGSSILSGGVNNTSSTSNNSSPLNNSNTLTSLPFFNLTTSMQPTKPLGSKICRWVQVRCVN